MFHIRYNADFETSMAAHTLGEATRERIFTDLVRLQSLSFIIKARKRG